MHIYSFQAWDTAKNNKEWGLIHQTEDFFHCCGYDDNDRKNQSQDEINYCTTNIPVCRSPNPTTASNASTPVSSFEFPDDCLTCKEFIDIKIDKGFNAVGGLGLFFALTEVGCAQIILDITKHDWNKFVCT